MPRSNPTAAVLIIGNEILTGRTQDSNLKLISLRLFPAGINLVEARVVPDVPDAIIAAVNALREAYDYIFTTGGIGPTHDDITAECIAAAFGLPLIEHAEARQRLLQYYGSENLTVARLRMARTPEGAELISNPISAAPGFRIGNVIVMAGIPSIMSAMLDEAVAGIQGGPAYLSRTVSGKVPESIIADELTLLAKKYADCDIGSYPWFRHGAYGLSLVVRGTNPQHLVAAMSDLLALMRRHDSASQEEGTEIVP